MIRKRILRIYDILLIEMKETIKHAEIFNFKFRFQFSIWIKEMANFRG